MLKAIQNIAIETLRKLEAKGIVIKAVNDCGKLWIAGSHCRDYHEVAAQLRLFGIDRKVAHEIYYQLRPGKTRYLTVRG